MKKIHLLPGSAFLVVVLAAVLIHFVSATGSLEPPLLDKVGPVKTVLAWNSKTETLSGGKKRHEFHAKQINFKDADGAFKPISVTPVATANGWEITQNTFIARFPARSTGIAQMVNNNRFDTRTLTDIGEPVQTMTITALHVSDVPGVLEYGDVGYGPEWYVRYPQAYPEQDADLIYLVWHGKVPRLQKLVRFNSALSADTDFSFQLAYPDKDPDFTPSTGVKWGKASELSTNLAISVGKVGDKHGFGMKDFRIWDAGIGAGRKTASVSVDITRGAEEYVLTKHVSAAFFQDVAYPVITDTTFTVYPDPNTETTTVDGTAYRNVDPSNETWSQVRDSAGNAHDDTGANNQIWAINGGSSSGQYSYNIRGIFLFDISSVPDTDTIISATESFYVNWSSNNLSCSSSDNSKIVLVNASPASNTTLADSDYGNVGTSDYGRSVKQSSLTLNAYNDITLSATGITALSAAQAGANIFKTGARSGWDQDNLAPFSNGCTWAYSDNTVGVANADTAGTSQDPKLVIETASAPIAPTSLLTEGQTNPATVTDLTPEFSAIFNDSTGDTATSYRLQVSTSSASWTSLMWDSGTSTMATTTQGSRSPDISYAGTSLAFDGSTYFWRIKFWDAIGLEGMYSTSTASFTMETDTPSAPSDLVASVSGSDVVLTWTDNSDNEDGFKIERSTDNVNFTQIATTSSF